MTRFDSLPGEVADWLCGFSRAEVRRRLASSIAERAAIAGLNLDAASLAANIDAFDGRYFDAQDGGKDEEAMRQFKCARLLSAQRFLLEGKEEDACYEFFHSLDDATSEALFSALKRS